MRKITPSKVQRKHHCSVSPQEIILENQIFSLSTRCIEIRAEKGEQGKTLEIMGIQGDQEETGVKMGKQGETRGKQEETGGNRARETGANRRILRKTKKWVKGSLKNSSF